MGSMTMDYFINIFLDLLHYVPYIKEKKVKIQQFLGCFPPNFQKRIEFHIPKTLETTLHKARLCYEHGKPTHSTNKFKKEFCHEWDNIPKEERKEEKNIEPT